MVNVVHSVRIMQSSPDFCRKKDYKTPSNPVFMGVGGVVVLSGFHGVLIQNIA